MRRYRYVGPEAIRAHWADRPPGRPVRQRADIVAWLTEVRSEEPVLATFVVDAERVLRVEDYGYEHVACAGGREVWAAGVFGFERDGSVVTVSNQSTGYCPESSSWPAVADALDRAGIPHPGRFTEAYEFRQCPSCGERNLVKDDWYVCGLCDAALPEHWNFT